MDKSDLIADMETGNMYSYELGAWRSASVETFLNRSNYHNA